LPFEPASGGRAAAEFLTTLQPA